LVYTGLFYRAILMCFVCWCVWVSFVYTSLLVYIGLFWYTQVSFYRALLTCFVCWCVWVSFGVHRALLVYMGLFLYIEVSFIGLF